MGMLEKIFHAIWGMVSPTPDIDVDEMLTKRAAGREELDWRNSIVDMLKVLNLDSSVSARHRLADELGYNGPRTSDLKEMNMWLHAKVMQKVRRGELS